MKTTGIINGVLVLAEVAEVDTYIDFDDQHSLVSRVLTATFITRDAELVEYLQEEYADDRPVQYKGVFKRPDETGYDFGWASGHIMTANLMVTGMVAEFECVLQFSEREFYT